MNIIIRFLKGEVSFNQVFWKWGIIINALCALAWFTCIIFMTAFKAYFTIIPLYLWLLVYIPIYSFILIRTKAHTIFQKLLKTVGILGLLSGFLTGLFWLYMQLNNVVL